MLHFETLILALYLFIRFNLVVAFVGEQWRGKEVIMDTFRVVKPLENIYSPNYTIAFKFENDHDYRKTAGWMKENWHTSFYYAAAYITFIFVGRIYMSTRTTPFSLKLPLTIWNIALAIFSITGTIRTWPEMYHVLNKFGFDHSVCANTFHKEVSQKND